MSIFHVSNRCLNFFQASIVFSQLSDDRQPTKTLKWLSRRLHQLLGILPKGNSRKYVIMNYNLCNNFSFIIIIYKELVASVVIGAWKLFYYNSRYTKGNNIGVCVIKEWGNCYSLLPLRGRKELVTLREAAVETQPNSCWSHGFPLKTPTRGK